MDYLLVFIFAIYVAYKMCQAMLVEDGLKKLKFLIFLFYEYYFVIYIQAKLKNEMSFSEALIILIGTTGFIIYEYKSALKEREKFIKWSTIVGILLFLFIIYYTLISLQDYELIPVLIIKVLMMLIIIYIIWNIKISENGFKNFILMLVLYIAFLAVIIFLSCNFINNQNLIGLYDEYVCLYNLPTMDQFSIITMDNIVNFIICRFMDAILISRAIKIFD
jgi:hypothetical protein